jgi:phosphoribosylformylglycinamidine cyclo-ligase
LLIDARRADECATIRGNVEVEDELTYARAGVDINTTDAVKQQMAKSIDVGDAHVLNRVGAFASLLELNVGRMADPVLVYKTDEPGSKQKLAFELGGIAGLAQDLVNHLINDVIVMGATPLYMQECIVCSRIDPIVVAEIVASMADACREQGCALVGGETSVQPDMVGDGLYVLSASVIGLVERSQVADGHMIQDGDIVVGVASNGLHTNGYTLVRRLLERDEDLGTRRIGEHTFTEVIMRLHRCYYHGVRGFFGDPSLKGMAHITGGGSKTTSTGSYPET